MAWKGYKEKLAMSNLGNNSTDVALIWNYFVRSKNQVVEYWGQRKKAHLSLI